MSRRCLASGACGCELCSRRVSLCSNTRIDSDLGAITEELWIGNTSRSIAWIQFSGNPLARQRLISLPSQRPYAAQTGKRVVGGNRNSVAGHEVLLPPHLRRRAFIARFACWLDLDNVEMNCECKCREALGPAGTLMSAEATAD